MLSSPQCNPTAPSPLGKILIGAMEIYSRGSMPLMRSETYTHLYIFLW